MEIEQKVWGFTPEGEAVILYTMRNSNGAYVELTNVGAAIISVAVPDRDGVIKDVALGYQDFMSYFGDGPAMGKTVGRYANRIAKGRFTLDGKEYVLAQNNGPNHLHGGPTGYANKIWESRVETNRVVFSILSPDGDENYPSQLAAEVIYDWDEDNALEITYLAKTDGATVVNLTNHAYFNLSGHDAGSIHGHLLKLNANNYLPTDDTQIPTGEVAPVAGTPMDFTTAKALGKDIEADFEPLKIGVGYDHCWVIDGYGGGKVVEAAVLEDPVSGRTLTISTNQPGAQVYTGNWLTGCPKGKGGVDYVNRDGVAIECQGFPDAPNKPSFPSQVLRQGELYERKIVYRFGVK